MTSTFCQLCHYPSPDHEANCPVATGQPVRGTDCAIPQEQIAAMAQQMAGSLMQAGNLSFLCPHCGALNGEHRWAGSGMCPGWNTGLESQYSNQRPIGMGWIPLEDGYEVAKIYKDARERLLEELAAQLEVNRRLVRELLDVRLELVALKMKLDA